MDKKSAEITAALLFFAMVLVIVIAIGTLIYDAGHKKFNKVNRRLINLEEAMDSVKEEGGNYGIYIKWDEE